MTEELQIDLTALQAEIDVLTQDQMAEQLLKIRTRQKIQQKKHAPDKEKQKFYQMKGRERTKLLKVRAIELGLWDSIEAEANTAAEAKIAEAAEAAAQ